MIIKHLYYLPIGHKSNNHKYYECPIKKVTVVNENDEYESMSKGDYEALTQVEHIQHEDEEQ